ncbi:adenylate/guanylate cyclase domain-containing protein [Gleimia sp. 6138-11-ORH1]|uniref:adenylate/guanylate cyclase domain-containing protein n=1 Tax=Gleimia sp. 6138-11-ORH1 TaxID=2973937 RepID=UPI002169691E|nr:adenylate/guanylate cyclase domain-containing protein [Gleimia sp. 6138-11-ORH1]MCS4483996.1 adenylate/guanylate cyclase domain-containing protein [Gleimia sp. 6138-11-ORH1]
MTHINSSNLNTSSTLDSYRQILIDGDPTLTLSDLASRSGTTIERVNSYWIAMGFSPAPETELIFTEADLRAYQAWNELVESGQIDLNTALSFARAGSHIADRLALWQMEALVDDLSRRFHLDDTTARITALDRFREFLPFLENHMAYTWKRQLESLLTRVDQEVSHRGQGKQSGTFPLVRTFGFVDMVSYTSSSSNLTGRDLIDLINRFETICRETIPASGGRVVKMIGDAVFYIADDLPTGLQVVSSLMKRLTSDKNLLPVRASIVEGSVFSRSGDVFGPPVNLASRLTDVSPVGQILTDADTAQRIINGEGGDSFFAEPAREADLRGVGKVMPFRVVVN